MDLGINTSFSMMISRNFHVLYAQEESRQDSNEFEVSRGIIIILLWSWLR